MTPSSLHNNPPPAWQAICVIGLLIVISAGLVLQTWLNGRAIELPDAAHEKLNCASYTPSHNGHTLSVAKKRELVGADLRILARRFHCVRTYSVAEGLDEVPKVAREVGLKVMLGLWISSHAPSNDQEIARGIALANEYQDVVTAVIVGNEVLLRREQTPAQMRALIERVRAGTSVPVTYADVWEFWMRNADLAQVTNFITVHILPYWEDHPIGIDHALDHVQSIYAKVRAAFAGKTVFIGETGWPSVGRPRLTAVPSLRNEARFIREFVAYAEREQVPYNLIEAFDQPWKRMQEGTVGGYWGLYSAEGVAKFPFVGPIAQADLRIPIAAALILAIAFALIGTKFNPRPRGRAFALLCCAGFIFGMELLAQWEYISTANRSELEWVATAMWIVVGWAVYFFISLQLVRWIDGVRAIARPASMAGIIRSLGYGAQHSQGLSRLLGLLRALTLLAVAYVCLALAYEGRGRDFPIALAMMPIVMFLLHEALAPVRATARVENEELLLALSIVLTSAYVAWNETWINARAMCWCGLCLLLGATIFVSYFRALKAERAMHPDKSAQQDASTAELKRI